MRLDRETRKNVEPSIGKWPVPSVCVIRLHLLLSFKSLDGKPFKMKNPFKRMEKLLTNLIKFHKISLKYMQADSYDSPISQEESSFLPFLFCQ